MIDLRAFYQDHYDKTLERKNAINNSLSVFVGIITALIAAFFYSISNFQYLLTDYLTLLFSIIALIELYLLAYAVYYLVLAFSDLHEGYDYAYLNSSTLNLYYENLVAHYDSLHLNRGNFAVVQAQIDFDLYIIQLLIEAANRNDINNYHKTSDRFKCYQYLIYSIVNLSFVFVLYLINLVLNMK